jgi:WD40 repeat protein
MVCRTTLCGVPKVSRACLAVQLCVMAAFSDAPPAVTIDEPPIRPGQVFSGHRDWVWSVRSWPASDGQLEMLSVGDEGYLRVWRGEEELRSQHVGGRLFDLAVSDEVVSKPSSGPCRNRTLRPQQCCEMPAIDALLNMQIYETGTGECRIVVAGKDGKTHVCDYSTLATLRSIPTTGGALTILYYMEDETEAHRVIIGHSGVVHAVEIFDPETGELVRNLHTHSESVTSIVTYRDHDGTPLVATSSKDRTIKVSVRDTGSPVRIIENNQPQEIWGMAYVDLPELGPVFVADGGAGRINLWNADDGALVGDDNLALMFHRQCRLKTHGLHH